MPDAKLSALPGVTAVAGTDEIVVNEAGTSKKVSFDQIEAYLETKGVPRVWALAADHAISTIAGTEVTGLGPMTLEPGTYMFQMNLLIQAATATVSPLYGINFTGTAAVKSFGIRYWDSGPLTAGTGTADDTNASASVAQGPISGQVHNAYTTTAPPMAHVGGVGTINTSILVILEGIIVVTAQGDLELWHGSETATSTTIKAGSSAMVIRTA